MHKSFATIVIGQGVNHGLLPPQEGRGILQTCADSAGSILQLNSSTPLNPRSLTTCPWRVPGGSPLEVTYNELLNAKVAARDRMGMWRIVDEMLSAGLKAGPGGAGQEMIRETGGEVKFSWWFPAGGCTQHWG